MSGPRYTLEGYHSWRIHIPGVQPDETIELPADWYESVAFANGLPVVPAIQGNGQRTYLIYEFSLVEAFAKGFDHPDWRLTWFVRCET